MKVSNLLLSEDELEDIRTDVLGILLRCANENPEKVYVSYSWFCKLIRHPTIVNFWNLYCEKDHYVEHPEGDRRIGITGGFRFLGINWEII